MSNEAINFEALLKKVEKPQVGRDALSIWGGKCKEKDILALIKNWPALAKMPFRIWEYSHQMVFEEDTIPQEANLLERGQLFGAGGDLSLRRDRNDFLWRFVGPVGTIPPPEIGEPPQNFWQTGDPEATFYRNEEKTLLWGERRDGYILWFDDRAARARLQYPFDKSGRVQIVYNTYSRAGRVEFVWLQKLEAYNG